MADRSLLLKIRMDVAEVLAKSKSAKGALSDVGGGAEDGAKKATKGLSSISDSMRKNEAEWKTATTTFMAGGAALLGAVGLVVKAYSEFDGQMSAVAATGEDARDNLDALRQTAITLGADTQFSAGEAAQGIEELAKAGVSAADAINGGLKGALDLAAAGGISVADAAETAATAMTQFQLSGKDVPHIADLLAAAAGKAQGGVSDIAFALKQSGLVAAQFGLSIEETVGSLGAFASAGMLGSDAGTSFRNMLLRLANPADEAASWMKELGINAYDANGEFVGIATLAQQLQDGLGGLTQATRDQALAQIFGTDAIRAANILYEQGAAGINNWIDEVNESGYAVITAATMTDNLAGDVERLGGAFDTLLINSGSGMNDFLRSMAQAGESVLDSLGQIPAPVLNVATGFAGVAGAGMLALGALGKVTMSVNETRDAMKSLAAVNPRLAKGLGTVGAAAAIAGTFLAAAVAVETLAKAQQDAQYSTLELSRVLFDSGRAVNEVFEFSQVSATLFSGIPLLPLVHINEHLSGIADAANRIDNQSGFGKWADTWPGVNSITEQAAAQFRRLDETLSQLSPEQASEGFRKLAAEMDAGNVPIDSQIAKFPLLAEKFREVAAAVGVNNLSNEELIAMMKGDYPEAVERAIFVTEIWDQVNRESGSTAEDVARSLEEQLKALNALRDATLEAESSQGDWLASIDEVTKALKENGRTLDPATEKGRKNIAVVEGQARAGLSWIQNLRDQKQALIDTDAPLDEINRKNRELEKAQRDVARELMNTREKMGDSREEAYEYARRLGLIPDRVSTAIEAPGSKATKDQINALNNDLLKLQEKDRQKIIATFSTQGYKAAKDQFDRIYSKQVKVTVNYATGQTYRGRVGNYDVYTPYAEGGPVRPVVHRAEGGWGSPGNDRLIDLGGSVKGHSPHPKADNIRAMLTGREFVQPVKAVDTYGGTFMESVRTGRFPVSLARMGVGLAEGGRPDGWQPARTPAMAMAAPQAVAQRPIQQQIIATQVNPHALLMAAGQRLGGL